MSCAICETAKPRRACPVRGGICAQCCGREREVTIDCPLDCEHLLEARKHEKYTATAEAAALHSEVNVTESFIERNDMLLTFLSVALRDGAAASPGCTDADMREAMDAMIRTYKTADSGLIYETRPENPFAARIQTAVNERIAELQRLIAERAAAEGGAVPSAIREKDLLGVFVFLIRVAHHLNNGRLKGRAFLSMLATRFPAPRGLAADGGNSPAGSGGANPASGSLLVTP